MLKRGILLLATGHPYYGRMAYNLALTIRKVDRDISIALVMDHGVLSHLSESQLDVFSHFIPLPHGMPGAFGAKTHLYDLSPFEETLFLDVDMAWLPKQIPADLFNEMEGHDFSMITEGYYDVAAKSNNNAHPKYFYWAKPEDICRVYNLETGRLYQFRSEVVFFRKGERMEKFFATAKAIHKNHGLPEIKTFANHVPDELAFNISAAIHDIHPHMYRWAPSLWFNIHDESIINMDAIFNKYYLLSCGSHMNGDKTRKVYNSVVASACHDRGVQYLFPLASKHQLMKERKNQ